MLGVLESGDLSELGLNLWLIISPRPSLLQDVSKINYCNIIFSRMHEAASRMATLNLNLYYTLERNFLEHARFSSIYF
jgi:hypothetical protein